jgi:hypothetical protein
MKSRDKKKFQFVSLPVCGQADPFSCAYVGCVKEGLYKAPRGRDLKEYWWFCLEHVQTYNASWNYYKGMSFEEVELENQHDTTWGRPTRPFNTLYGSFEGAIKDPFGFYKSATSSSLESIQVPIPVRQALRIMGLEIPYTLALLKKKYKELAKQHHPDLNKGSKISEEKLKKINAAYQELKIFFHRKS